MSYPTFHVYAGDVLPIFFDTFAGNTGASITLTGLAVTDIEIYKDGSTTQRASDAGYTLLDTDGIDFDGLTGIHGFSIDTGDNTDAGFYTVGAWFTVVVSAVTVDSQTVSFVAAQFRLMPAENIAGKPKVDVDGWLGTACATPTVAGVPEVDVTHVGGTAQTAGDIIADTNDIQARLPAALVGGRIDANVGAMANNVLTASAINADAITDAKVAADVTIASVTGSVGSVTGNVGGNVVGSVGSVVGLTPGNLDTTVSSRATPAQVNAEVVDVLRVDTISELAQAAPAATPTIAQAVMLLYMSLRNAGTTTSTSLTISNDAGTVICKATLSDDGTTFTKAELVSGP